MADTSLALPGQILGQSKNSIPGPGTHISGPNICASIAGIVSHTTTTPKSTNRTISIHRHHPSSPPPTSILLPTVSSTVLARITRTTPRTATCTILSIDDAACADGFQGQIRTQDVRATEKDKVKISESFRPGDVVRAVVISLGDQASYYLSTARNELGVVMARSEAGNGMFPVSWREFRDPVTGVGEGRKVARPY